MYGIQLLVNYIRARFNSEEGASAVEYGLVVSLVAVAIVAGVKLLGTHVAAIFTTITNAI